MTALCIAIYVTLGHSGAQLSEIENVG